MRSSSTGSSRSASDTGGKRERRGNPCVGSNIWEIKPCNGMRQTCAVGTSGSRGALSAHWKRSGCGWSGCGGALSALGTPHGTNILRLALNGYLTSGTGSLDARDKAMSTRGEGAAQSAGEDAPYMRILSEGTEPL